MTEEDSVLWSITCDACDHEWMQTTPEDSDPKREEVECPECGSELLHAEYAGRS
jgi:DNA-directed RNA polymerase subunit RPC12/RpoP